MIYLRNRYYDPSIGRFISEDTYWNPDNMIYGNREYKNEKTKIPDLDSIMQSSNLYIYCIGNPIKYADSKGLRTYIINGINNEKLEGAPDDIISFAQSLENKGVTDVRTIGVYNGTNIVNGTVEVALEMLDSGLYSDYVAEQILTDLKNEPLGYGEQLNIVGYSGGGQIALNSAELLAGEAFVNNVILIGSPVTETTINNVGNVVSVWSKLDILSWNIGFGINFECVGWIGHTSYFNEKNVNKVADIINKYID